MPEPFNYERLPGPKWIRILHLYPKERDSDRLMCSLEPVRLGSATQRGSGKCYEALSYTWGDPQSHAIECDGRTIFTTKNCYRALRLLQILGHLTLWVDSICINQSDLQERSSQVQLMSQIFVSAKAVLVWLGEEDSVEDGSLYYRNDDWIYPSYRISDMPANKTSYNSLLRYLSRPWFSRVWILQEVMLSKRLTVLLDHEEVEWEIFWSRVSTEIARGLGRAKDPPTLVRPALRFYTLASTSKLIRFLREDPISSWAYTDLGLSQIVVAEFGRILNFSTTLNVSDPRDRIYALLGMSQPLGIEIPVPDYSKSVEVVFQEAIIAMIKKIYEVEVSSKARPLSSMREMAVLTTDRVETRSHPNSGDSTLNTMWRPTHPLNDWFTYPCIEPGIVGRCYAKLPTRDSTLPPRLQPSTKLPSHTKILIEVRLWQTIQQSLMSTWDNPYIPMRRWMKIQSLRQV